MSKIKTKAQQAFNMWMFESVMELIYKDEKLDTAQGMLNKDRCELAERVRSLENARISPEKVIARLAAIDEVIEGYGEIIEQLQISRSAEMLYHNDMIKRMDGLESRLSRAQDMIAEDRSQKKGTRSKKP